MRVVGSFFAFLLLGLAVVGQQGSPPEMFEVPDLELVSYAALPGGTEAYTAPVCTAIVLAWFSHHGFAPLLPDLNGDGVVNELDTVQLASQLAETMEVRPERGAWDPWLVDALARYVGERVPGTFVLKIYDDSFPDEYQEGMGRPFDPDAYPGIAIELRPNPNRDAYAEELLAGEGVILGVGPERTPNRFFVGRSFVQGEQPEGWPVDLVDTRDDPGRPGPQGMVLPTFMREGVEYWLLLYGEWQPMEIMLALSPQREPEVAERPPEEPPPGEPPTMPPEEECPPDRLGFDRVDATDPVAGRIIVEECVVRQGDRDIYTYALLNVNFTYPGAPALGICEFRINNISGVPTLDMRGPPGWTMTPSGGAGQPWVWTSPPTDPDGIMPWETAQFVIVVPAPTKDVPCQGTVAANCHPPAAQPGVQVLAPHQFQFTTTGPDLEFIPIPSPDCPDLTITRASACWEYGPHEEVVLNVRFTLNNVGTAVAHFVKVCVQAGSASTTVTVASLNPGASKQLQATLTLPPSYAGQFPISVTINADCTSRITECDEANNERTITVSYGDTCP